MTGIIISPRRSTATGATASGYVTVGNGYGFYVSAKCYLQMTGGVGVQVQITEINNNTIGLRILPEDNFKPGAAAPNYGRSNLSSFVGSGFLYQPEQYISTAGHPEIVPVNVPYNDPVN